MEKILFNIPDSDETVGLFVLEQTCINGVTYLLVTEEEVEDSVAYIMKEIEIDDSEVLYEMVEDDVEMDAISRVFAEMLEDVDFE